MRSECRATFQRLVRPIRLVKQLSQKDRDLPHAITVQQLSQLLRHVVRCWYPREISFGHRDHDRLTTEQLEFSHVLPATCCASMSVSKGSLIGLFFTRMQWVHLAAKLSGPHALKNRNSKLTRMSGRYVMLVKHRQSKKG